MDVCVFVFFFFFQAEDGIRDLTVTGVQTCALPISRLTAARSSSDRACWARAQASASRKEVRAPPGLPAASRDRKSTRLNSSHSQISYAVFCLKKKKKKKKTNKQKQETNEYKTRIH